MAVELTIHEVYDDFPKPASDEELDRIPPRTIPRFKVPKAKKRRKSQEAAGTEGGLAVGTGSGEAGAAPVQLHLFAQSRRCWVPAELAARAPAFFAGKEPSAPLRLRSPPQQLSEDTPFVTAESIVECLEAAICCSKAADQRAGAEGARPVATELPERMGWLRVLRIFAAARLLGFEEVATSARMRLRKLLGPKNLRAILAAALAWNDGELLRACYWPLLEHLCDPPPSPAPKKFGVHAEHFEYQQRQWPLHLFAPAAEAGAKRRALAQAAPVLDGFTVCRLHRSGFEVRLSRETSTGAPEELLRAALGGSSAVLYMADEGQQPSAGVVSRRYCEGCVGTLEVSRLGHRFELYEGVELLPGRGDSGSMHMLRERFPYPARRRLGAASWDLGVLASSRGQSRWRLTLEAPDLPKLTGHAAEAGRGALELAPPGREMETPWLMIGPSEGAGTTQRDGAGRTVCWRHPISTAWAFVVALAMVYPWDPGGSSAS